MKSLTALLILSFRKCLFKCERLIRLSHISLVCNHLFFIPKRNITKNTYYVDLEEPSKYDLLELLNY